MPRYKITWPSSDLSHAGVAVVQDEVERLTFDSFRNGEAEEVFDVAIYGTHDGTAEEQGWYAQSVAALEALVENANRSLTAVERIEAEIEKKTTARQRVILAIGDYGWIDRERDGEGRYTWEYVRSDDEVRTAFAALDDEQNDDLLGQASGDDYETLDGLAGEIDGLEAALAILRP